MKIRGTDFVMFRVSDLAAAARFYRDVLGLRQLMMSEQHHWAEFDCGNVTLSLLGGAATPGAPADGRIALAVEDVGAACEELKTTGVDVGGGPVDYGCCQAIEVTDPDGNTVVLHHRADGTFGPDR
jgi:catechol 2,3-dioxygenase-like lactoylglutathione lyase family enzyme